MRQKDYILHLEDDAFDALRFSKALNKLSPGLEIVNRIDGQEGLDWLLGHIQNLPSIIILDLNMPGMDGMEFLSIIKKDARFKQIPVIILSGSKAEEHISNTFKHQVAGYMVKPFNEEDFAKLMLIIKNYWENSVRGHV